MTRRLFQPAHPFSEDCRPLIDMPNFDNGRSVSCRGRPVPPTHRSSRHLPGNNDSSSIHSPGTQKRGNGFSFAVPWGKEPLKESVRCYAMRPASPLARLALQLNHPSALQQRQRFVHSHPPDRLETLTLYAIPRINKRRSAGATLIGLTLIDTSFFPNCRRNSEPTNTVCGKRSLLCFIFSFS